MYNDGTVRRLFEFTSTLHTVDAHQHLCRETPVETDLCRLLIDDNYLCTDLVSAGLSEDVRSRVVDPSMPLACRWDLLSPFWRLVRHGSYAQAILYTLRDLYGADKLDSDEVEGVSSRLAKDCATPGLFRRILWDRCKIDVVLTQGDYFEHCKPRFLTVARPLDRAYFSPGGYFEADAAEQGIELRSADAFAPAMDAILRAHHARGAVGFKMVALPWSQPTQDELKAAFRNRDKPDSDASLILNRLYASRIATIAQELDLPVAVHTGAPYTNWLDFRAWEPTALIPLFLQFRDTRFDLYHAGIPYGTQMSMLGKTFPNVWFNLTWAHIISCELAMRSIAEWLDLVPCNKVIAFGGDYKIRTVVLTYGHLVMARNNLSRVLASRVRERRMTENEAQSVLQAWFSENPRKLYKLPPPPE